MYMRKRTTLFLVFLLSSFCLLISQKSYSQVSDYDGNVYKTVIIGNQEWMSENLRVEHYRNGDLIPRVEDIEEWKLLKTGSWCYYQNKPENGDKFGKLYSWYAVNDKRGLAPKGWHIPSDEEWSELIEYLGGEDIAGIKLKEINSWKRYSGETNESGFSALPGGVGLNNGYISQPGWDTFFWSTTECDNKKAWFRSMFTEWKDVSRNSTNKMFEMSIRCVRN